MVRSKVVRLLIASTAAAALLAGLFSAQVDAQSEFMDGEGYPYDAFDALPKTDLSVRGGVVHVGFAPGDIDLPREKILGWIKTSAKAVSTYYGRFPVRSARLLIVPVGGPRVAGGTTWGYAGAAMRVPVGREVDDAALADDWVMTHEMVHLALPDVGQRYVWLAEGFAVYVEPVARVQAGDLTEAKIWTDMVRDMPKGLPRAGDRGLDGSASWGRIYWGGALFCLMADVEIRKRTNNKLGLQDAMRGVLAAGGDHEVRWTVRRILETADKAVGQTVLIELYDQMRDKPMAPDLPALWRDLGVVPTDGLVRFDDTAPLAAIRAAIVKPPRA